MIKLLLQTAHQLDGWLHEHLGRPYSAILAVGLVLGIGDGIRSLTQELKPSADLYKIVFIVIFQVALLINQLGQFHEFREAREAGRAAKRAAKGQP